MTPDIWQLEFPSPLGIGGCSDEIVNGNGKRSVGKNRVTIRDDR